MEYRNGHAARAPRSRLHRTVLACVATLTLGWLNAAAATEVQAAAFDVYEARIEDIHRAIRGGSLTATDVVIAHLRRIAAYDGVCVHQPDGILGPITTVPEAGQINSLSTLNLRPSTRAAWGLPARKARSLTDLRDGDPDMPDALETAAMLDRHFAETGELIGPLHGIPFSIKDQFDTFDMRTTSGADVDYANDRPPQDADFIRRLREAGAVILAKANMGEYASGDRSAFGGTFCNPYDTERTPGRSSGGSGSSVSTSMVVCSIGEETGPSARNPAHHNSVVALSPTQELVSRHGLMPASFMSDRAGPTCRSVEDVARVLDVIAGYDEMDELTAFSVGRLPAQPYASHARAADLKGVRVGVLREYMDTDLFTPADAESIRLAERAAADLRSLGATVVDPGAGGQLLQACVNRYAPSTLGPLLTAQFPQRFRVDEAGAPVTDHLSEMVQMYFDPERTPDGPTIRDLGPAPSVGERRYMLNRYLAARGDSRIRSVDDLIEHGRFFTDIRPGSGFNDKRGMLVSNNEHLTLDMGARLQMRFAVQQIVLQCMAQQNLDVLLHPTTNIPAAKLGAPTEPTVNGRPSNAWSLLGRNGFPAITVPAGFTTAVYDRVRDERGADGTVLVGPVPATLPVGVDFVGRPFAEPLLFKVASAYEAATGHREPPPAFGPLDPVLP